MATEKWIENTAAKPDVTSAALTLRALQAGVSKRFQLAADIVALLRTADLAAFRTALSLVTGSFSLSATDRLAGRSSAGPGAAEEIACTAAGRALLDDADAQAQCKTLGAWKVLGAGAAPVAHTGNTNETVLATIPIPANSLGPNGAIRISTLWSVTNSANNKTARLRLGASGVGGTSIMAVSLASAVSATLPRLVQNRNATNSQVTTASGNSGVGSATSGAVTTAVIDTTAEQNIVITGQLANSGETITLESYLVEVFHGA